MRKILLIGLLSLSILAGEMKSPMAKEVERMKFPPLKWDVPEVGKDIKMLKENGSVIFLKENHNLPLVEITIYVRGGRLYTDPTDRAVCELLAPMLERGGTKDLSPEKFSDILDFNAISFSVDQGIDHYTIRLSCMKEVLDTAFYLLKQALFYPSFNERIMKVEIQNIKDTWRKNLETPSRALWILSDYVAYDGHPAGSLPDFTIFESRLKEKLQRIHRMFFVPEHMVIGVVGDVTEEEIRNAFKDFKPDYKSEGLKDDVKPFSEEPQKKVFFYNLQIPQGYILLQERVRVEPSDLYRVMLMNEILGGGGFTSRIVLKVRNEMGLAYSTYTYFSLFSSPLPTHFYAFSATRSDAVQDAIDAILNEIKRIRDEKVSEEEIKVAKDSYLNSTITRYSNDWRFIPRIVNLYFRDMPLDYYSKLAENINNVGIEDVLEAARKYINPDKLYILIVGDTTKIDLDKLRKFGEVEFVNLEVKGL